MKDVENLSVGCALPGAQAENILLVEDPAKTRRWHIKVLGRGIGPELECRDFEDFLLVNLSGFQG